MAFDVDDAVVLILESVRDLRSFTSGNVLIVLEARTCCVTSERTMEEEKINSDTMWIYNIYEWAAHSRIESIYMIRIQKVSNDFSLCTRFMESRGLVFVNEWMYEWMTQFSPSIYFYTHVSKQTKLLWL